MTGSPQPFMMRNQHDLRNAFDVLVGKTPLFLHAARDDSSKPVDLTAEDPVAFHDYLNLVYLGRTALCGHLDEYTYQTESLAIEIALNNLHERIGETALIQGFDGFGDIESFHVKKDKYGDSTGRGYIRFATAKARNSVLATRGFHEFHGKLLNTSRTPPCRPDVAVIHKGAASVGNGALIKP